MDDDLLRDQLAFYRQRAPEYDEWWQRRGRYDKGPEDKAQWAAEVVLLEAALEAFGPSGDVLELAGGTGWWTSRLAPHARRLTVVDGSPETLNLNRQRVGRADVNYVHADLFAWEPDPVHIHDVVFFSFWLSHVPRALVAGFWALVGRCLAPAGRVFFIDNRFDPTVTVPDPYVFAESDEVQRRRLNDGSEHRVVKIFYEPDKLTSDLAALGWHADVHATDRSFVWGEAWPTGTR
jgi:demethylmenaquinone methyltransferase/2-methoxy-6-polyprenyl-1,4-benzoquinol methylase